MSYLIDTCIISEFRKKSPNLGLMEWSSSVTTDFLFISVVTLAEIHRGIELQRLKNVPLAEQLDQWASELEAIYVDRTLPITKEIAFRWGGLGLQQPMPTNDAYIAATALEHRLTVVTRNIKVFERSGVRTLNPFS